MSKKLKGSKKLQYLINKEEFSSPYVKQVFKLILNSISQLSTNEFGNFVVQVLVNKLSDSDRIVLWSYYISLPNFDDLIINKYANFIFITLIQLVNSMNEESIILARLKTTFDKIAFYPKGSYLIQNVIKKFESCSDNIENLIITNFFPFVKNINSMVIIQNYIYSKRNMNLTYKAEFLSKTYLKENNFTELLKIKFGCKLIYKLIDYWGFELIEDNFILFLRNNFMSYYNNKHTLLLINEICNNKSIFKVSHKRIIFIFIDLYIFNNR
jgi:hypothetical protein